MKMMKKWLSLLLCGVLLLSTGGLFAACGQADGRRHHQCYGRG